MKFSKNFIIWALIFIAVTSFAGAIGGNKQRVNSDTMAFSDFMNEAENKKISEVTVSGADVYGITTDGRRFYTYAPDDPSMIETLRHNDVKVNAKPIDTAGSTFWGIVISWFPMLLLVGVWVFLCARPTQATTKQ